MNEKFAFIVVLKSRRKKGSIKDFSVVNVVIDGFFKA
jgi:hypothetical protein